MPKYAIIDPNKEKEISVSLEMREYFGCKLPTLVVAGVSIAHLHPDGNLLIRSRLTGTSISILKEAGMKISNHADSIDYKFE